MVKIETSIEINATPQTVWGVLMDFQQHASWNPFIKKIERSLKKENSLNVILKQPNGGEFKFSPAVLKSEFPELRWKGKFIIKGLFDGEHYFRINTLAEKKVQFIHGEKFGGILLPLMRSVLKNTESGFVSMNEAIKARSENLHV
jgi:hypothetical protein